MPLPSLPAILSELDVINRLKALEQWRKGDADPNIQSLFANLDQTIQGLQAQAVQLQDQTTQLAQDESILSDAQANINNLAQQAGATATTANNAANQAATAAQDAKNAITSLQNYITGQVGALKQQGYADFASAIAAIKKASDAAATAATTANAALTNLKTGIGIVRDRAGDAYNSLSTVISAFRQYGNVIGFRAAHVLDAFSGPGHLFNLVNDIVRMLNNTGPGDAGDPQLHYSLPAYSIADYFGNVSTAFYNLYYALYNLAGSF